MESMEQISGIGPDTVIRTVGCPAHWKVRQIILDMSCGNWMRPGSAKDA
jgi:hypothetical protein